MRTLRITLPDQLAQEAERAGLLLPETLARILREQLKARHADELFSAIDHMTAVDVPPAMSPEEVASEIAAMRAKRRTNNPS